MKSCDQFNLYSGRYYFLLLLLFLATAGIVWRMVDLTVLNRDFLLKQGNARTLRMIKMPAYRGMVTDRNGEPLAISTPVESVWVNPQDFAGDPQTLQSFSSILDIPVKTIKRRLLHAGSREFIYLKRGLSPEIAAKIRALSIPGVYLQREFHRFYPEGEVTAHLVGFTNIDDQGQEGIELAYDKWLEGQSGKKRVLKDRLGHIVADIESIQEPRPGHNLVLSIDRRIQYLAYRALKNAVKKFKAKSGSAIVLDIHTGEVLAMANLPSYNPNRRDKTSPSLYRNRAVTDLFEPGSVMKAFTITTALASGEYRPESVVNTAPGWLIVEGKTVKDERNYGSISLSTILQRSSNVGVTKIIFSLDPDALWQLLSRVGFGRSTGSGFPGESSGFLMKQTPWRPLTLATLAFGYGMSVTPLQLAHAYSLFGRGGQLLPVSLLRVNSLPLGKQVISKKIADDMLVMLRDVVGVGTGKRAWVKGYQVAGKTGTVRMVGPNGYQANHHIASFVGLAPVSHPRLVVAVVITDPRAISYYGSVVAAPVFSEIMADALRVMDVSADEKT